MTLRIATFPIESRQTNLADHIVRDARHVLVQKLGRELGFEDVFDTSRDLTKATVRRMRQRVERVPAEVAVA